MSQSLSVSERKMNQILRENNFKFKLFCSPHNIELTQAFRMAAICAGVLISTGLLIELPTLPCLAYGGGTMCAGTVRHGEVTCLRYGFHDSAFAGADEKEKNERTKDADANAEAAWRCILDRV